MFTHAIVRTPAPNFAEGITTDPHARPSYTLMVEQHAAYLDALRTCGLQLTVLNPLSAHPDGHFVEDPAIMVPEIAIVTRPGALARRGEADEIAPVLERFKPTKRITAPGTLDGGDVLVVDKSVFVGISERTNEEGATQLGKLLDRYDYTTTMIPVGAGLHLKSSLNYVGKHTLLMSQAFADHAAFASFQRLIIDPEEAYACNTLWVNDRLLMPAGYPRTHAMLQTLGLEIIELETSEVRKMDGGLTCMSLRFAAV